MDLDAGRRILRSTNLQLPRLVTDRVHLLPALRPVPPEARADQPTGHTNNPLSPDHSSLHVDRSRVCPQLPVQTHQHRHNRCSRTHMEYQRHIRDDSHFGNIHDDLYLDSSSSDTRQRSTRTEVRIGDEDGEMSVCTSS